MVRNILAVVLGLVVGSAVNMGLITLSNTLYPLPPNVDPNDFEAFTAHVNANGLATGALLIVLAAHAGGSFASGVVCGLIANRAWYAAAVGMGLLWLCGGVMMLMMLSSPLWFAVADLALYVPAAILGVRIGGGIFSSPKPDEAAVATDAA